MTVEQRGYVVGPGGAVTFAGDGVSGFLFWGAQLELGLAASSYIPTNGAAVARAADTVTLTPLAGELSASEGSAYVEFMPRAVLSGDAGVLSRGGGASLALVNGASALRTTDGTNIATGASGTIAANDILKMASHWGGAPNELRAAARLGGTLTSATAPFDGAMGSGNLVLGDFSGQRIGGWLRRMDLWPTRQADASLDSMV